MAENLKSDKVARPAPAGGEFAEGGTAPGREHIVEKRGGQTAPARVPVLPTTTSLPVAPPPPQPTAPPPAEPTSASEGSGQ